MSTLEDIWATLPTLKRLPKGGAPERTRTLDVQSIELQVVDARVNRRAGTLLALAAAGLSLAVGTAAVLLSSPSDSPPASKATGLSGASADNTQGANAAEMPVNSAPPAVQSPAPEAQPAPFQGSTAGASEAELPGATGPDAQPKANVRAAAVSRKRARLVRQRKRMVRSARMQSAAKGTRRK